MVNEEDTILLKVGNSQVGIIGLSKLLEEAKSKKFASEDDMVKFLLDKVKAKNYVPYTSEIEYSKALLREYKRFVGILVEKDASDSILEIKVLGPGCPNCQKLEQDVISALSELNLAADVEHIKEPAKIGQYGVLEMPALIINGKAKSVGGGLGKEKIKQLLLEAKKKD